jgi:hypothetical protein
MEIQGIIRDYFGNVYSCKFEKFEEMDRFLDTYYHPKLNQEELITRIDIQHKMKLKQQ